MIQNYFIGLTLIFFALFYLPAKADDKQTSLRSNKNARYFVNGVQVGKGKTFEILLSEDVSHEIEARVQGFNSKFEYIQANYPRSKLSFIFFDEDLIQETNKSPIINNELTEPTYSSIDNIRFRALIIANEDYIDPRWADLSAPIFDAENLKNTLEDSYGFTDTIFVKNANRQKLYESFKFLIETTKLTDRVLVFYAGHGHYDNQVLNTGYWVPVDAMGLDESTFVSNEDIKRRITLVSRKATNVLLISDSCFSGNFITRGFKRNKKPKSVPMTVSNLKSTQALSSGGNEYVSDSYGDTQSSPFAHFLLRRLKLNNSPTISASNLAAILETSVPSVSGQSPKFGTLQGAENEGGDFVFYKRK